MYGGPLFLIYAQVRYIYAQLPVLPIYSQLPQNQKKKHCRNGNAPSFIYYLKKSIKLG